MIPVALVWVSLFMGHYATMCDYVDTGKERAEWDGSVLGVTLRKSRTTGAYYAAPIGSVVQLLQQ